MSRQTKHRVLLLGLLAVAVGSGCAEGARTTFDIEGPRVYVWTRFDPQLVRESLEVDGLSVREEACAEGGRFVVCGIGSLRWSSVEISVTTAGIVVNGVVVQGRPDQYSNVVINEDGEVVPGAFLPFERPCPPWRFW